jgi:hypothetical protein
MAGRKQLMENRKSEILRSKRKMTLLAGVFGMMFFAFFMVNQWVDQQIRRMADSPVLPLPHKDAAGTPPPARPRPVQIDPLNDPLAPVARRGKPKADAIPARPEKPKKIYEPSLKDTFLIQ